MSSCQFSVWALLCAGIGWPVIAGTASFSVVPLGGVRGNYQYTYNLPDDDFTAGEEYDFVSPADLFATISGGTATPGFAVELYQPNVPAGADRDFTAMALTNTQDVTGPWTVDVAYIGLGGPGVQTYFIDRFMSGGILAGNPLELEDIAASVPEPDIAAFSWSLLGYGACRACASAARRRCPRRL